jgi:hypothetical protein
VECGSTKWIELAQHKDGWQAWPLTLLFNIYTIFNKHMQHLCCLEAVTHHWPNTVTEHPQVWPTKIFTQMQDQAFSLNSVLKMCGCLQFTHEAPNLTAPNWISASPSVDKKANTA